MSTRKHNPRNEKPVSLRPLKLEEALKKAMEVKVTTDYTKSTKVKRCNEKKQLNESPSGL